MAHEQFVDVFIVLDWEGDGPAVVDSVYLSFEEASRRIDDLEAESDPDEWEPNRFEIVESYVVDLIDGEK